MRRATTAIHLSAAMLLAVAPSIAFAADVPAAAPTTANAPSTAPATQPATIAVKRGKLSLDFTAPGTFVAADPLEVCFRLKSFGGDLFAKSISPNGAHVAKGASIIDLEPSEIDRQIAAADDELAKNKGVVTKLTGDGALADKADALALRQSQKAQENAERGIKWFDDVEGKQLVEGADLAVKQNQDQVDDQEDELDQLRKMYKTDDLTTATADIVVKRAVRNVERAKEMLTMAKDRAMKVKQFDVPVARQKLVDALDQANVDVERLKLAQAQDAIERKNALSAAIRSVGAAAEKVGDLKSDRSQFTVAAPADGIVIYGGIEHGAWQADEAAKLKVGEKLTPGIKLLTFFVPGHLQFVAELPEARASQSLGQAKLSVSPTSLAGITFAGIPGSSVAAPIATAHASGAAFDLTVSFEKSPDARIMPGMKGLAAFNFDDLENVLTLPLTAVNDGKVSRVVSPGKTEAVDVITGATDGTIIEIKSGLREGDQVLERAPQP